MNVLIMKLKACMTTTIVNTTSQTTKSPIEKDHLTLHIEHAKRVGWDTLLDSDASKNKNDT